MIKLLAASSLAALALTSPSLALAHQAGDFIVRTGAIRMDPQEKSSHFKSDAVGKMPYRAKSDNDTQFGLNATFMFSEYLGLDLLTSTPFKHRLDLRYDNGSKEKLGQTKHLPFTLSLVYFPLGNSEVVQPYLGAGVNYSVFYNSKLSAVMKDNDYSHPKIKNSLGVAGQIGMDIDLGDNFIFNAQARYIKMDTKISARDDFWDDKEKANWNVDPLLYMLSVGYKF